MENASGVLVIRKLRRSDIPVAMRLKEVAGWNQIESDWAGFLELEPEGCFAGELDDTVVTTATAVNYGGLIGWIGMVLVEPSVRRRGIATRMMQHAIQYLEAKACRCPKLDATEAGAQVYGRFGFQTEYKVERWVRQIPDKSGPTDPAFLSKALELIHLERILELDFDAFGADRSRLLRWYLTRDTPRFLVEQRGEILGYILSRPGHDAVQMGPLVAKDPAVAGSLMSKWMSAVPSNRVIADAIAGHEAAILSLQDLGFEKTRILERMYRAETPIRGKPEQVYCLAGFEFG